MPHSVIPELNNPAEHAVRPLAAGQQRRRVGPQSLKQCRDFFVMPADQNGLPAWMGMQRLRQQTDFFVRDLLVKGKVKGYT